MNKPNRMAIAVITAGLVNFSLCFALHAQERETVRVFIFAGQSNMVG